MGSARYLVRRWYHGAISRDVADQMLMGKPAGTYIVRFSSTKNEYCISLVNQQNAVQHFATVSDGPKLALHGHKNQYASVIDLVDHYTRHDITVSEGARPTPATLTRMRPTHARMHTQPTYAYAYTRTYTHIHARTRTCTHTARTLTNTARTAPHIHAPHARTTPCHATTTTTTTRRP